MAVVIADISDVVDAATVAGATLLLLLLMSPMTQVRLPLRMAHAAQLHTISLMLDGEETASADDARSAGAVVEDHETAAATRAALSLSLRLERLLPWMKHVA
jgi:hypothetical protein